jgi:hypothetical protein
MSDIVGMKESAREARQKANFPDPQNPPDPLDQSFLSSSP